MGVSTHSIEVNAPLRVVYNQWTQFEEFPHFMEAVEEVRQEGEKRLFGKQRSPAESKNGKTKLRTRSLTKGSLGKVLTEVRTQKL